MKRILKFILCAALLLPLSGCGSAQEQSAVDALVDASIQMQDMRSANLNLAVTMEGTEETLPMMAKISSQSEFAITEDDIQIKADLSLQADDVSLVNDLHFYLKENCIYYDDTEVKEKMTLPINLSALMSLMGTTKIDKAELKEQYLELYPEIKWEDESKGVIALTYDEAALQEQLNTTNTNDFSISMKEIKGTYTIQNNHIQQMGVNLILIIEGHEVNCNLTIGLSNINEFNEISFPDLSDYVEVETNGKLGDDGSYDFDQNFLPNDEQNDLFSSEDF